LDEPTTGLHFADIQRLLEVLTRLVDGGNTVLVIEHNLDVIKTADYIMIWGQTGVTPVGAWWQWAPQRAWRSRGVIHWPFPA
jgi:excinuclease UvrABC ATPase subunit